MDAKNVIAAISLSAAVIILYGLFFAPDPQIANQQKLIQEKNTTNQTSEAPSIDQPKKVESLSRNDSIAESERITFENENIKGTISLTGAIIDDLTFVKYTKTLNGSDNIVLLNPRSTKEGYFVETGWVTNSENIDTPNSSTVWNIEGNKKLTSSSPIKLFWENNQGIKFEKQISIDNHFLFNIDQKITNSTNKNYNFYPYGQIIRNTAPEVTNFYILHEGLIGVFDDQLVEKDYDDIEDKKYTKNASKGWTGITDKFWTVVMIPEENRDFRKEFE